MTSPQTDLFGLEPSLPEGFRYGTDLISSAAEAQLVRELRALPLKDFEFHGYTGKRRVVSYGWRYDFNESVLRKSDDMPALLLGLRETAAAFAGMKPTHGCRSPPRRARRTC